MNNEEFRAIITKMDNACNAVLNSGQKEYARDTDVFANFEKLSLDLGISREQVLWVQAMKHRDGIASYIRGVRSQREDVRGRIIDLINYLRLLYAMVEEDNYAVPFHPAVAE